MSTADTERLVCPACRHAWSEVVYRGLHISRIPHVREEILAGTWQTWPCPACGRRVRVNHSPVVYTDFPNQVYIAVEGRGHDDVADAVARHRGVFDAAFTFGPPVAEELGQSLRPRLVFGLPALREKLVLLDAGLDDHVVEAAKGDHLRDLGLDPAEVQVRVTAVADGGHLLVVHLAPDPPAVDVDGVEAVQAEPPRAFDTILAPVVARRAAARARIADDYPWLGRDWLVDVHVGARARG